MILALSQSQILTITINLPIMVIFIVLSYLLIKRNRNRFSFALAFYFITVDIGLLFNFIYRIIDSQPNSFYTTMNLLTISITAFAGIHLLHFNLLLVYSTKIYNKQKHMLITIGYGIIMIGGLIVLHFFVPDQGISWIGTGTEGDPKYSLGFGLYGLVISQIVFLIIVYTSLQIKQKMGNNVYGKKFIRNIIGVLFFDLQLISGFIRNMFPGTLFDTIALILAIGIIFGAYFLYSGLKKAPETT